MGVGVFGAGCSVSWIQATVDEGQRLTFHMVELGTRKDAALSDLWVCLAKLSWVSGHLRLHEYGAGRRT